jgi:hypothetical protein
MKAKENQHHQLGPQPEEKEVLSSDSFNMKADWLVASAVDDIYNLEDEQ